MGRTAFDGLIVFCADVASSARFYEEGLGLRRTSAEDDVTFELPTKGDPSGAWLLLHPRTADESPHPLGFFAIDDVDSVVRHLRDAGYRITEEPHDEPWGVRQAGVLDPDGYALTLTAPVTG